MIVLLQLASTGRGATIKFDQSQTGDYNLQIHLKNIELYAVFDDSGGSDDEVSTYTVYVYQYLPATRMSYYIVVYKILFLYSYSYFGFFFSKNLISKITNVATFLIAT